MQNRSEKRLGRRQFIVASAATVAAHQAIPYAQAADTGGVMLRPSGANDLFRVRIEMEAEGNINVPDNPLVSRKSKVKLPLKSTAKFDYEERFRRPENAAADSVITLAERYYHVAESTNDVNQVRHESELRDSVREAIVRRERLPEVVYAVEDYFQHEELDLLRLPVSSVAVDRLLPTAAVRVGSTYQPAKETLTEVLNLTSIEATDVQAEIMSITEADAKIQFRGKVDGSVDGVPTVIRVLAKLTFDRILGTSTWLAMAVHETREIGKAEPGFDISATIKLLRKPLDRTIALPADPRPLAITAPIPKDRLYVDLHSDSVGFGVLMDRRWRMMSDVAGTAMMRMIDQDRSIAQCDIRTLASLQPGAQWTLEALQEDVRRTLGEQLGQFIDADQRVSPGGIRVLRITAGGSVQGVPIRWVIQHYSDDTGRRILATFTMEGDHAGEFAGSDMQFSGSLRLTDRVVSSGAGTALNTRNGSGPAARTANAGANRDLEVQSASDLR